MCKVQNKTRLATHRCETQTGYKTGTVVYKTITAGYDMEGPFGGSTNGPVR